MDSRLIINHEVKASGSIDVGNMRDYYMREGQHAIGGLDRTITREDRELELRKSLNRYDEMVDYYSRTGRYEGRNPELPMRDGEVSGGCFTQDGLFDSSTLARTLEQSGSHIIRSVVSVRREDAIDMHLASKADFEHLLRQTWEEQVRTWNVIESKDVRWCAFFHTDNLKNLHCHVITWDASGRFGGDDVRPMLSRGEMVRGNEVILNVANRDRLDEINYERDYLREYLRRTIERECGIEISRERELRIETLREQAGSDLVFHKERQVDERIMTRAINEINAVRPDERNLSFERSNAEVKHAVENVTTVLRQNNPDFNRAYERYEEIIRNTEKLRGLVDVEIPEKGEWINPAKAHYRESMDDLNRRLGNAVIHSIDRTSAEANTRGREVRENRQEPRLHHEQVRENIRAIAHETPHSTERSRTQQEYRSERDRTRIQLHDMSRDINISRFGGRIEQSSTRALPFALRSQVGRNIELGRTYQRSGRASEANNLARETARAILREPMNSQRIDREAISSRGADRTEQLQEVRERIYSRYEQNLTDRISNEMQNDRANESSLTADRGVEMLGNLLSGIRGSSPQSSATRGGMRSHTHRSHDANRLHERNLDELYSRKH